MGRRPAALRVALRIARRNAGRARGRTALVAIMVALPVLAAVTIDVLIRSMTPTDATFLYAALGEPVVVGAVPEETVQARITYSCPGVVVQDHREGAGCAPDEEGDQPVRTRTELEQDLLAALPTDSVLHRLDSGTATVVAGGREVRAVGYGEVDLARVPSAFGVAEGTLPTRTGEIAVTPWLADRLAAEVGDHAELRGDDGGPVSVEITGILDRISRAPVVFGWPGTLPGALGTSKGALEDARPEWFVTGASPVTWDAVLSLNDLGVGVTSRVVVTDPPPRAAMPFYAQGYRSAGTVDPQSIALIGVMIGAGLLESVLLIGPAFAVGARRSARELALLAANGGEQRDLRRVVLAGGVVIGGVASVAAAATGVAIGAGIVAWIPARANPFPNLVVPWLDIAGLALIGTLIAVAAAWLPARHASRVDVVAALSGRRSEAVHRRAVPIVGLVLLGAGTAAAVAGALRTEPSLAVAGVMLLMVGIVAASGAIVTLLGRLAGRAPLAPRFALRDAARQRGRTAPAVAAVIAAVAGATAGLMYSASSAARDEASWTQAAALGTIEIVTPADGADASDQAARLARLLAAVEEVAPLSDSATVRMLVPAPSDAVEQFLSVSAIVPPANQCPLWVLTEPPTDEQRARSEDDPRCEMLPGISGRALWATAGGWGGAPIVDDGTVIRLLDMPGAQEAAAALAEGRALVNTPSELWPDGTVHLTVRSFSTSMGGETVTEEIVLPGQVVPWRHFVYQVVVPERALDLVRTIDVTTEAVGIAAQPVEPLDQAGIDAAVKAVSDVSPDARLEVEHPWRAARDVVMLVIVMAVALIGLGASWIAVGLAAAESRADLATLSAVGASPGVRRRIAGAQAGVIAGSGTVLGVLAGLLLGTVLVLVQRAQWAAGADLTWQVVVPWPTVALLFIGLPTLAVGAVMLVTRPRLPLVRRIAT